MRCDMSPCPANHESRSSGGLRTLGTAMTLWMAAGLPPALLAGCAVGPNYHAPAAPKTQGYTADALPSNELATAAAAG
jgi:hypothetical protein